MPYFRSRLFQLCGPNNVINPHNIHLYVFRYYESKLLNLWLSSVFVALIHSIVGFNSIFKFKAAIYAAQSKFTTRWRSLKFRTDLLQK